MKQPVCTHCGSSEVLLDAYAVWDMEKQAWVLQNTFDAAVCEICDGECNVKMVEVK